MRRKTGLNLLEMIISWRYICWVHFEKKVSQLVGH